MGPEKFGLWADKYARMAAMTNFTNPRRFFADTLCFPLTSQRLISTSISQCTYHLFGAESSMIVGFSIAWPSLQDTLTPFTNSAQLEAEEGQATDLTNTLHYEEDDENIDPVDVFRQSSQLKSFAGTIVFEGTQFWRSAGEGIQILNEARLLWTPTFPKRHPLRNRQLRFQATHSTIGAINTRSTPAWRTRSGSLTCCFHRFLTRVSPLRSMKATLASEADRQTASATSKFDEMEFRHPLSIPPHADAQKTNDLAIHPSTRLEMPKEEVDLVSTVQSVCMIADLLLKDDTVTFDDTSRSGQPSRSPKLPHRLLQPPHTVPCRALSYLRPPPLSSARQDQKSGEQHQTSMDESGLVHFALSALRFGVTAELCDDKARIDGYHFDEQLLQNASKCLSSICWTLDGSFTIDAFLVANGQGSPDPTAVDVLSFIRESLLRCSFSNRLALVSSKLIPRILSTPHLRDLSGIDDQNVMTDIREIFDYGVLLSSEHEIQSLSTTSDKDPESTRDVVLNEVLIPIEPSLVQISRNPHLLPYIDGVKHPLLLLSNIFDVSAFHQPTLDFVSSSHIPMAYQSLISKVEHEYTHQFIIWKMNDIINIWKRNGTETMHRGNILLQTLEREGFGNHLEQTLLHNKSSAYGPNVRNVSYILMKYLGMNSLMLIVQATTLLFMCRKVSDSWIIVIHTALLVGMASSSDCASPPADEHDQPELHLIWLHWNRQHLVEPAKTARYPSLSQIGRRNFRRDLAQNVM
ncbi:hypothetical protein BLNAU_3318 [Blattamonas nauphoetae]|uniref:Anaphase-promoting complex subunit 1 n=1 Tax=Blattamonas nauphoetae TaxID=2049346 RepID=A0ABQ9YE10_9EUKA|nr:hypothetical protein BLNAU_3318 [Blattamonas nauphoetae]